MCAQVSPVRKMNTGAQRSVYAALISHLLIALTKFIAAWSTGNE